MPPSALSEYAWELSYTRMAPGKVSSCSRSARRDEPLLCNYSKCSGRSNYPWLLWFIHDAWFVSSCWVWENAWCTKDIWVSPKTNPWLYRIYAWRKTLHQWTKNENVRRPNYILRAKIRKNQLCHPCLPTGRLVKNFLVYGYRKFLHEDLWVRHSSQASLFDIDEREVESM